MLKKKYKGYLYLLPALIVLLVFVFYPIINTVIFSFDETKASGFKFGIGSYKYLFNDKRFRQSLINTLIYAAVVPFLSVSISLLLANALVHLKNKKLQSMFQSIYFLPYVTSLVAIGIVWSWLFNSEYGVILPSLRNNELDDTILKSLYKRDFYLEEISEKIRLFYVMLTRCREKMIIVTSLNKDMDSYNRLVPKERRMKYRSFLDILDSIGVIDKYVKDVFCECEKDYDNIRLKEIENDKTNIVIRERVNKINYQIINNKHFSKETNKILDMDTIKKMETGTRIHEELEYASFDDDSNKYIKNLFDNKKISRDYINKYSEYEFIYEKDNMVYNGVIDLMLEYDNYINIIDYKLKNISDDNYIKQLNGYKEYIESISNKKVYIYLYSLVDNILEEL